LGGDSDVDGRGENREENRRGVADQKSDRGTFEARRRVEDHELFGVARSEKETSGDAEGHAVGGDDPDRGTMGRAATGPGDGVPERVEVEETDRASAAGGAGAERGRERRFPASPLGVEHDHARHPDCPRVLFR
jgi:hypothetical protein